MAHAAVLIFIACASVGCSRVDDNAGADVVDTGNTMDAGNDRDAGGDADVDMIVWTAVFHTGGNPTPVNCDGWTVADNSIVPTGLANRTDTGWTVFAPHPCSAMHRLYCFEQ
jgi:hypothetical protein